MCVECYSDTFQIAEITGFIGLNISTLVFCINSSVGEGWVAACVFPYFLH